MGERGSIPFGAESARESIAIEIAGALAEYGVTRLRVEDPRACRSWELVARGSNLPAEILALAPGSTLSADGVALLIDEADIRWVADAPIAAALTAIKPL